MAKNANDFLCYHLYMVNKDDYHYAYSLFSLQSRTVQKTHQEMRYPNVTSLYFATHLAFNAPDGDVLLGPSA